MRILFMASLFAGLLLFVSSNPVIADVVGSARVIDGDTLEISGQRIRIHGIDAPEGRQTCTRGQAAWLCGHTSKAMRALRGLWAGEFVAPWDWRKEKRLRTRLMMRSRPRVGT